MWLYGILSKILPYIVALFVAAVWGSSFVFIKVLLNDGLSPINIVVLRFVVAYVILLFLTLFVRNFRYPLFAKNARDEILMIMLGITGCSLFQLTQNISLNLTTSTNTSLIVSSCPLFTALLGIIVYKKEHLSTKQIIGLLIAFMGTVVIILNGRFLLYLSPSGDILAFVACLCWACYQILLKRVLICYPIFFITRKVFFYGIVTMLPYHIMVSELPPIQELLRIDILLILLYIGGIASVVCYLLWNWCTEKLGAVRTTEWLYFSPVFTIILAWCVLNERITIWFLAGTVAIIAGIYLSGKTQKKI